jgi:hypothetical protein
MQLLPLVGFYWKHSQDIEKLVGSGHSDNGSHIMLDLAQAAVPLLKKYYPQLNTNGLLDDGLSTLKEMLTPPAVSLPPADH